MFATMAYRKMLLDFYLTFSITASGNLKQAETLYLLARMTIFIEDKEQKNMVGRKDKIRYRALVQWS